MQDQDAVRLFNTVENQLVIHRNNGPQIDDFQIELIRNFQRRINSRTPGDNRCGAPFPLNLSFPEWDEVVRVWLPRLGRDVTIEPLVFEKENGIVASSGGLEESFRILGVTWEDDVPARGVRVYRFDTLRMERTAFDASAACHSHNERIGPGAIAAPTQRRNFVAHLHEARPRIIRE